MHFEDGVVFAEPGIDLSGSAGELRIVRFGALNLFFGGVQAVLRRDGALSGAGDPRRGGVAVQRVRRGRRSRRRWLVPPRAGGCGGSQGAGPVPRQAQRRRPRTPG